MQAKRSGSLKTIRPFLFAFLILTILIPLKGFSLVPRNPFRNQTQYIPYYSHALYQAFKINSHDDNLKYVLKSILKQYHISKPGQLDQIVDRCPTTEKDCAGQISLGYDRARVFLMGYLYLIKQNNQYAIKEAYCNKYYGQSEFGGKKGPAPQTIPDNTVINIEHTWPQSRFSGGYNKDFQKSDLHHLFPTDSELNAIRGNKTFGEVGRDTNQLKCGQSRYGISKTSGREVFEPPTVHKGRVARALFYFSVRYDIPLDPEEEAYLKKWNAEQPVDQEEITRNEEIYKAQGNRNPFIDYPELASLIADF